MFVEIILPVPLLDSYTYSVPPEIEKQIKTGVLVRVPFGNKKQHIGIVAGITKQPPENIAQIKQIISAESENPVALPVQIRFWRWIAEYYLCQTGIVFHAAFPAGLQKKQLSKTKQRSTGNPPHAIEDCTNLKKLNILNRFQQKACEEITRQFSEKDVCLLHGVTFSGKTEIYIHLIDKTLKQNRQVLCMMPEIALTTQITSRLKQHFGDRLVVYHSKISERERAVIWNRMIASGEPIAVLGVRSSIFLPFQNLGLAVIDEEHEPSYKQHDPAPRYHARNAAIILARLHGAKVLLGSATPSLDSYRNAQIGKYGYTVLEKRFEDTGLPEIIPVDVKELRRKKLMKSLFSPLLSEKIQTALEQGGQVLLFLNRRGFSPALTCKICDWTPRCRFCDISLSYHKQTSRLTCHYCGRTYSMPVKCPDCGNDKLRPSGFGTEKVEEEIRALFPDATVARMDSDTAGNRQAAEEIIARFENRETQILIGTQMISKGPDFEGVSLAGILNADSLMNLPDFRAGERTFQLIEQVAGRTGRRNTQCEIILQVSRPDDPLIQAAIRRDYRAMAEMQLEERQLFHYPPFCRIISIDLRHRDENTVHDAACRLAELLRTRLGDRIVGPDKPPAGRIRNSFIRRMLLKIENTAQVRTVRQIIVEARAELAKNTSYRYVSVVFDVDPML